MRTATIAPRCSSSRASEVTIHDTWDTLGLRGTASNDFSIEHAFVPETRGFQVLVDKPVHPSPLYRTEPLGFINHGAQSLGVARGAIESTIEIAAKKDGWGGVKVKDLPRLQSTVAEASALVGLGRHLPLRSVVGPVAAGAGR